MAYFEVVKTIYLDNGSGNFLRYELLSNGEEEVTVAAVYVQVTINQGNSEFAVWSKIADVTLDHLGASLQGFQTQIYTDFRPGKCISTAIDECKRHRASWDSE
jgi:hypothetical protein